MFASNHLIHFLACTDCRAINVNPVDYLEDVMRHIMSHPRNGFEEVLPESWALEQRVNRSLRTWILILS